MQVNAQKRSAKKFAKNFIKNNMLRFKPTFGEATRVIHDLHLKNIYRKHCNVHLGNLNEFILENKHVELDTALALHVMIDWYQPLDPEHVEKIVPIGSKSLGYVDYTTAPRATKNFKGIKAFKNFDTTKYDPSNWWGVYSKFHMESEPHHMDFWHLKAGISSFNDTIELLVDQLASAMRLRSDLLEAYLVSMSWIYDTIDGPAGVIVTVKEKYKRLNPIAVLFFILYCAGRGFSKTATNYLFTYSQSIRSRVYPFEQLLAMNQVLTAPFDEAAWSKVYVNHMNAHFGKERSCFKDMLRESQQHIVAVQNLYREFTGKFRMHDHAKVNAFMNACLCVKFLKFVKPKDEKRIPLNLRPIDGVKNVTLCDGPSEMSDMTEIWPIHKLTERDVPFFSCTDTGLPDNVYWSRLCHDIKEYFDSYYNNKSDYITTILFLRINKNKQNNPEKFCNYLSVLNPTLVSTWYAMIKNGQLPLILIKQLIKDKHVIYNLYYSHSQLFRNIKNIDDLQDIFDPDYGKKVFECMRTPPLEMSCMQYDMLTVAMNDQLAVFKTETSNFFSKLDLKNLSDIERKIIVCLDDGWLPMAVFEHEEFKKSSSLSSKEFLLAFKNANSLGPAIGETLSGLNTMSNKLTNMLTGIDVNANNKVFSEMKDLLATTLTEYRVLATSTTNTINKSGNVLSSTFGDAAEKIKSLKVQDLMDQFSTMMNGMTDMSEIVATFFKKLNFFIPNFVKPFGFSMDSIKNMEFGDVTACVILYLFYINTHGDLKYVYLLGLLYKLGILSQLLKGAQWVLENLGFIDPPSENFGNDDTPSECLFVTDPIVQLFQYVFCEHKYMSAIIATALIVGFVGYGHLHTAGVKNVADFHSKFVKSSREVGFLGQGLTGATKIFGFIVTGITVGSQWILNNVFKKNFKTTDEILIQHLNSWMTYVEFFDSRMGRNLIVADKRFRNVAALLHAKGIGHRDAAISEKIPRGTLTAILAYLKRAKSISEFCETVANRKSGRMCTRHINFDGPSNIGKSALMPIICDMLCDEFHPGKLPANFAITPQMINSDDWDGYRSDIPVCTIDDLNALREPKEAATVIILCSNAKLTVPVAALESKGTQFESEFLVSTCNQAFPADLSDTLRTPEAYFNRFHYSFKVERNDKFSKCFDQSGKFSPSLFDKFYPTNNINDREWLLFTHQYYVISTGSTAHATGPNGETLVKATWNEMQKYLLANLRIDRQSDPFKSDKTDQLFKDVSAWFKTVQTLHQNLEEDLAISYPIIDRIAKSTQYQDFVTNYDHQIVSDYADACSTFSESDIENFCENYISETSYTSFDKFWDDATSKAAFHTSLPNDTYVFKLNNDFINDLTRLHEEPIDPRLVFTSNDTADDTVYPNISMPKNFQKYLTSVYALRKIPALHTVIPFEDERKIVTYVKIDRKDIEVLMKPSFIAAIQRYLDAPSHERIGYFKNVVLKQGKTAPLVTSIRDWLTACKAKICVFCRQLGDIARAFRDWMIDNWKINLSLLLAFGGSVWALQRLAKVFLGKPSETAAYTSLSASKASRHLQPGISNRSNIEGFVHSIPDHVLQQNEKIQKNQFILVAESTNYCHGLGIKGDLAIVNYHSVTRLFNDPTDNITISFNLFRHPNYNHSTRVQLSRADCMRVGEKDQCFIRLNALNFRDITNQLPMAKEYPTDLNQCTVSSYIMNNRTKTSVVHNGVVSDYKETFDYKSLENNSYKENHHVILSFPTRKGNSGAFVVHNLPHHKSRILGIVSSSSRDYTHVTSIFKEDADKAFENLKCSKIDGPLQIQEMSDIGINFSAYFEDHVPFVGEVAPSLQITPYGKLEHFKSPISDYLSIPNETAPAILDIRDPRANGQMPLALSVGKRSRDTKEMYPPDISKQAIESIGRDIKMRARGWSMEVCDPFTAVTGRRMEGYAAIDLTTSPGLPYLKSRTKPGKRDFVEIDGLGQVVHFDSNLYADIDYTINSMKCGIIPNNSLYDFPKSEDLPLQKIYDVKTRSITNSNLCFSLIYRMFCMDAEALMHMLAKSGTYWYAPGLNPESPQWANLYHRLSSANSVGWCFDIKNFDGGFDAQMFEAVVEILNYLYNDGPLNAYVRRCLAKNALNGFVQIGMLIYASTRGMPSGFAGTTLFNTIGHMYRLFCAYLRLAHESGNSQFANWNCFIKFVIAYIYGDDLTVSIHNKILSWFNGNEIAKEYQRMGWKVTMGVSKKTVEIDDPEMLKGIPISDLVFLKRGFKSYPEIPFITCPLDLTSIHAMLHWVRHGKFNTPLTQFYDNVYTALFSLYHHGKVTFESYLHKINSALSCVRLNEVNISFNEVHQIMLHRYFGETVTNSGF